MAFPEWGLPVHWIQALIGSSGAMVEANRRQPSSVVCPLPQGLALMPLTDRLLADLYEQVSGAEAAVLPHSGEIPEGVVELASSLSHGGPIAYVATYIYGGTGGQDALIWIDGKVVLNIGDDEDNMSKWPDSPISRALRHIGVSSETEQDEFDALGLGLYRSTEAWADSAP